MKMSQLDKAIASLQGEINVLEAAISALLEQKGEKAQRVKLAKGPKAVPDKGEKVSA